MLKLYQGLCEGMVIMLLILSGAKCNAQGSTSSGSVSPDADAIQHHIDQSEHAWSRADFDTYFYYAKEAVTLAEKSDR